MHVDAKIQFIFSLDLDGSTWEQQKVGQSQTQKQQLRHWSYVHLQQTSLHISHRWQQKCPHSTTSPIPNMPQENRVANASMVNVPIAMLWLSMVELNPLCRSSFSCMPICLPNAQISAKISKKKLQTRKTAFPWLQEQQMMESYEDCLASPSAADMPLWNRLQSALLWLGWERQYRSWNMCSQIGHKQCWCPGLVLP